MAFALSRDWIRFISKPYEVLNDVFATNVKNTEAFSNPLSFHFSLKEELEKYLEEEDNLLWIPLMSKVQRPESLESGSVVRFRCMVQDMFDPEITVASVKRLNEHGDNCFKYSLYTDTLDECGDINIQEDNKLVDRYRLYCVSIPYENEWVLQSTIENINRSKAEVNVLKRLGENIDESSKKMKRDANQSDAPQANNEVLVSEPPKEENSPVAVVVKFYDLLTPSIKLNDKIDVIGILDLHSEMNDGNLDIESEQLLNQLTLNGDENRSNREKSFPTIHAILVKPIMHNNPLVTHKVTEDLLRDKQFFVKTKMELKAILTKALLGDELAAEYLLLSLVSKVFNRRDITPVGSLPINFTNCPLNSNNYLRRLYSLLATFIPNSQHFTLTLESLNKEKLVPKKNYDQNKLSSAILQMTSDTFMLIDESQMTTGGLSTNGLNNFRAIKELIHKQQVSYDFHFEKIAFDSDVNVVVFSERSSLFSVDCKVALRNEEDMTVFDGINEYVSESLLRDIRIYLTLCKQVAYELSKEMQTFVEHDLVAIMNEATQSSTKLTIDDMHLLLTVSRLLAISEGETSCSVVLWKTAKQLEQSRRNRLQA